MSKQEEMLRQIETEREKLRKQEDLIRAQQQERLQNVRQEKNDNVTLGSNMLVNFISFQNSLKFASLIIT